MSEEIITFTKANSDSLEAEKKGKLFLVSTPIGNPDDITRRATKVLGICDLVVCEEIKEGAALLHRLGLRKEIELLNEQNEIINAPKYIELVKEGKNIGVISDGGTPLLADPGSELMRLALLSNIDIEVVPGASSFLVALVRSGFSLDEFLFAGFLPLDRLQRSNKARQLLAEQRTVALLETPYRLRSILDLFAQLDPSRQAYLGMNLTIHYESHHYGTFEELAQKFKDSKAKGEFVLVWQGATKSQDLGVGERIEREYKRKSGNLANDYRYLEGRGRKPYSRSDDRGGRSGRFKKDGTVRQNRGKDSVKPRVKKKGDVDGYRGYGLTIKKKKRDGNNNDRNEKKD
ncbi:MAG: hypothetical protein Kapaf2KO_19820 [Candidatus Kapaibacteriales bacterium]